jgi:hypothetical protein
VAKTLFAERFAFVAEASPENVSAGRYDDARNLTVTPEGRPYVERGAIDATRTGTYAGREPPDSDRAWELAASADTVTKADRDRDHWGDRTMDDSLFAERFVVGESSGDLNQLPRYDEDRNYNVTSAGLPHVEAYTIASTNTFTRVNAEPSDADRSAWERLLNFGLGTRTQATRDCDHW